MQAKVKWFSSEKGYGEKQAKESVAKKQSERQVESPRRPGLRWQAYHGGRLMG